MPEEKDQKTGDPDEELLKTIREDFRYVKEYWRENHERAEKSMRVAACLVPSDFAADRKGRPCIWPDEISQYVKQCCNNLRQTKRSIKVSPRSDQATDQDAEHRQAYIRGIEYASKAQSIYTTGFEAAVQCGFGYWKLTTRVTGPNGEQEPRLARIPNQFSVYPDPDAEEADFSDSSIYFLLGPPMREKKFVARFGNAKKRSFSGADRDLAPDWFNGDSIIPAEYWTRKEITLDDGEKRHQVTQRITNGLEILETNEWIGSWIPIIGVFGEELYVKDGGKVKRMFLSLIHRAIDPQQMLAYVASQEAEEFGMAPRAPFIVVKGTVDSEEWKVAHKVPTAYLEYSIPVDWNPAWGAPPAPTRPQFTPNPQAYEMARESWRRAIQAAMGITPLPTSAQRQNEKSGVALEKIQNQEAVGSFHITDNFVRALENTGRQANELITKLAELDSLPKQLFGKDQKDEDVTLHVVPRDPAVREKWLAARTAADPASEHLPEDNHFFAHRGQFQEAISDGPSYQSQREEGAQFADTIFQTVMQIAQILPPGAVAKMLALAVKMKNIGAIGDEMVDVLDPQDNTSQQLQQAQQQIAMAQQAAQAMQAEIQKLQLERAGKVIDNEYKVHLKQLDLSMDAKIAQLNADLKAYIANVQTKAQSVAEREKLFQETQIENHHAAHDLGLQKDQQAHEKDLADQQAQTAALTQAADQAHQQTMAAQPPPTGVEAS